MDGSRMTKIYLSLPGVITVALRYDSKHFYWVMTDASVTLGVLEHWASSRSGSGFISYRIVSTSISTLILLRDLADVRCLLGCVSVLVVCCCVALRCCVYRLLFQLHIISRVYTQYMQAT